MNDLRQAAQQALEVEADRRRKALAAEMRAALAQQAEPVQEQDVELSAALGWPGGVSNPVLDRKVLLQKVAALMQDKLWEDHRVRHLWDHTLAQQAEPVEPAAYIHRQGNHWEVSERHLDEDEKARGWTEEPLYTAPPQRKPLTEEEIDAVWDQWFGAYGLRGPGGPYTRRGFARAVERAHGITDPQIADRLARHGIPMPGDPK